MFKIGPKTRMGAEESMPDASVPVSEVSADAPDLNYPDDLQIQAFNDYEAALLVLYKKQGGTRCQ
jgi:hypothetical protein